MKACFLLMKKAEQWYKVYIGILHENSDFSIIEKLANVKLLLTSDNGIYFIDNKNI